MTQYLNDSMSQCLKSKLMTLHIHARPAKSHTLHPQTESLFSGIFSAQLDRATRPHYTMPGQSRNLLQNAHHLARGSRPSRSLS